MNVPAYLRALLHGLDDNSLVPVRVDWLRELLEGVWEIPVEPTVEVDLTCADVAEMLGRDTSIVRTWCRAGLLPGAYRLRGREWRIPRQALTDFQRNEQSR